jgi:hypothetical protein
LVSQKEAEQKAKDEVRNREKLVDNYMLEVENGLSIRGAYSFLVTLRKGKIPWQEIRKFRIKVNPESGMVEDYVPKR